MHSFRNPSLHHQKLTTQITRLTLPYSTSTLTNIFSKKPPRATAGKPQKTKTHLQNAAQTMAHLINSGPWSQKLESLLSAHTQLSQTTVIQILRLVETPQKTLRFFNWAQDSGFEHDQSTYFLMLEILGRARNLNPARTFLFNIPKKSKNAVPLCDKFFNSLIRSYGKAGFFQESVKVFKTMKSMGISPSVVTFNSLFSILFKRGRTGMVYELYDEMLKTYGVKPDLYTFNTLIRGFCLNSMIDEAFRIFKEMDGFKCEPDLITYNSIVDGLCRAGKVSIARNVINGMSRKVEDLRPNVVSYTTLIRGYCGKGEIDEALDVLKEMMDKGIKPNEITYNTIIQGLCDTQRFCEIKDILEGYKEDKGFVPDSCTFNTIMNSHCNRGDLDEAMHVFEKMKKLNVKQDSASYSIMIRALCQKGDFARAELLYDELSQKEILLHANECKPLVAAYNPIFEYLCKNGKTKKAERVFRQLTKRGTQDPPAFKTLILGYCKEGNGEYGHELLILMLRRNFVPDVETYESLINVLLQKGKANLAFDTLEKMLKSLYTPRASTFHRILMQLLKHGSASESARLLMVMLEKEVRQNISLSTDTVQLLFKCGLKDKAFEVVKCLHENGFIVNMEELVLFLCQSRKFLEACNLLVLSLKNDEKKDRALYSAVLTGLCQVHSVTEAFDLYYELLEKGIEVPVKCIEELTDALRAEGKLKEAEFVAKHVRRRLHLDESSLNSRSKQRLAYL